jgi:hypothetical protein
LRALAAHFKAFNSLGIPVTRPAQCRINIIPSIPIIYVCGFAAAHGEIEETVADPYMGFNLDSTEARQVWDGILHKFFLVIPKERDKAGSCDITTPSQIWFGRDSFVNSQYSIHILP